MFAAYQGLILATLVVGLGGAPSYARLYPAWDNARRIPRLTPSALDVAVLIGREPIFEYGRRHPVFGVAVWSFELTWWSLLFFLSFSTLVGLYLGIGGLAGRWGAAGSLSGAGLVFLAIKFLPTMAKIEERDNDGVDTLHQMWFDWRFWWAEYEDTKLPDKDIVVQIGPKLPTSHKETLNELNNMLDRRVIDTRIIMPVSSPIVFQSIPLMAWSCLRTPLTTIRAAPISATMARLTFSVMITA